MLIPYDDLKSALSPEAFANLIKEYLLQQIGDQGFDQLDGDSVHQAQPRIEAALKRGELVVEFSEEEESVAIRAAESLPGWS